jgi:isonocardicin synthase
VGKSSGDVWLRVGFDEKPFDIFVLSVGGEDWVGRKRPARVSPGPGAPRRKGCLVEPSMILGRLVRTAPTAHGHYLVAYAAAEPGEAEEAFRRIDGRSELSYPLLRLRNGAEVAQPPEFWDRNAEDSALLDADESLLREEVCRRLDGAIPPDAVIYDPACSSGAFLARLLRQFPRARAIGQDRSARMAALARDRIAEVHLGDSLRPACAPGSADVVLCRHLNVDVVVSGDAPELFRAAAGTLRPGGLMVVLGHTPVLLRGAWMEAEGFEAVTRCALTPSGHAAFQLYILRRRGA